MKKMIRTCLILFLLATVHAKVEEVKESKPAKAAPAEAKETKPKVVVEEVKQNKPTSKEKTPEPKAKVVPVSKTVVLENVEIGAVDIGKKHALKIHDQFTLNTSCFWELTDQICAISQNFCFKIKKNYLLLYC